MNIIINTEQVQKIICFGNDDHIYCENENSIVLYRNGSKQTMFDGKKKDCKVIYGGILEAFRQNAHCVEIEDKRMLYYTANQVDSDEK